MRKNRTSYTAQESSHLKEASAGEDTYFRYLRTIRTPSDNILSLAEAIF